MNTQTHIYIYAKSSSENSITGQILSQDRPDLKNTNAAE